MIPFRRRVVFALLALGLVLAGATILVRVLERGGQVETTRPDDGVFYAPVDLLKKEQTPAGEMYVINDSLMVRSRFAVRKPPRTTRIITTGGSFIMGTPYVYQGGRQLGFGGTLSWLGVQLEMRVPGRHFDVINAAGGGQNSIRTADVVSKLLEADPDIMIVGTGNNEGSVPATVLNHALNQWAVYRMMKKALLTEPELAERPALMQQDLGGEESARVFRGSLERIVDATEKAGVRLVLLALPINLRYDPAEFLPVDVAQEAYFQEGERLRLAGRYEQAVEQFEQSAYPAWAARQIGESLLAKGDIAGARAALELYVELNPLNRTRPIYNDIVRSFADRENVLVVDLDALLCANSPQTIPDPSLFFDYCHAKWPSHALFGRAIADALLGAGWIPSDAGTVRPAPTEDQIIAAQGWEEIRTFAPLDH